MRNGPISNDQRQRAFGKARRHSMTVSVLKLALPVAAFTMIGGFAVVAATSGAFQAEAPRTAQNTAQGEIVMANPRLDGLDRNQRAYALTANAARQQAQTPGVVALDTIDAKLPTDDGEFARIDATAGTYDTEQETLVLSSGVKVRDLKGMDMDLSAARFDMAAGTMTSDQPVEVRSRNAAIDAESMKVLDSGKRILFSRRVRMVIHNDKAESASSDHSGKAALLGAAADTTAPWVHTNKLSLGRFAGTAEGRIEIRGTN